MATVSELTFAERVVLPFCALIPLVVGTLGYWVWKREKRTPDERMSERMSLWFVANCASMLGLALFHVLRNVTAQGLIDDRLGMGAFGASFLFFVTLALHLDVLQMQEDNDLLLNDNNETGEYLELTPAEIRTLGNLPVQAERNVPRRRYVAFLVYGVIVFQSAFDGLVLKYNPNGSDSVVQVTMFMLTKAIESVVISTALIHSGLRTCYYCLYMCNFTATVALSTLSAYDLVDVSLVIRIFEHWIFQLVLGASGGLLFCLGLYFLHLEGRSRDTYTKRWAANLVFVTAFGTAAVTGLFG
jgi:hypothetical protein